MPVDFLNPLILQALLGVVIFTFIPVLVSENRSQINKKLIAVGLFTQVFLIFLFTQFSQIQSIFQFLARGIESIRGATQSGTSFVFGYLGGGMTPFDVPLERAPHLFIFAFQALPMLIVVSALSMLLFYWNVIPRIVRVLSYFFQHTLHVGGAMGIVGAANSFFGQIESSMLVRPYLVHFQRSEIFMLMCCGMATTSATVMAIYGGILSGTVQNPVSHILIASVINIPCAITLARIIVPQEGIGTNGDLVKPYHFNNAMDAVSRGTQDGLQIFLGITAMLIVMSALVSLMNAVLSNIPTETPLTLQLILGYIMAPMAWLMGIPGSEALAAGKLLGTKTVLNEIFAFMDLTKSGLSAHSSLVMTYGLCGFSNFTSLGVMISGIGAMAPEKRSIIIELGVKSILVGMLTTCLSGTFMGILARLNPQILG